MRQLNEKLIVGVDSDRRVYLIKDNRSIKEFELPEEMGNTHDFIVTNKGADFYELMFSTSQGIFFANLKVLMRGNNYSLQFNEEEKYFEDETITAMTEMKPNVYAMAIAGSNYLHVLDRDKQKVV